jgi:hypothetical protein
LEPSRPGRESVLADPLQIDPARPIVLVLPLRGASTAAVAVRFDLKLPSADEAFEAAAERTQGLLARSAADAAERPEVLPVRNDAWSGYERVMQSDAAPAQRRAAMNYVAAQTQATLAQDLLLVVDEQSLQDLHQSVLASMPSLNREGVRLGWLMDYAAIKLCADRAAAGPLPSTWTSVLTLHLGEAGRNMGSLSDLISGVTRREELEMRVMVENLIYLEDSNPAARVRAFDFLSARGKAPQGYEPLAPPQERRDALERAASEDTATQPTESEVTP